MRKTFREHDVKIRVKDSTESKIVQKKLFELGYHWQQDNYEFNYVDAPHLYIEKYNKQIFFSTYNSYFESSDYKEVTVAQLMSPEICYDIRGNVVRRSNA